MSLSPSSSAQKAREAIAKRLGDLRQDAGLKGRDLAVRTGWSESKVSRIANARTPPSDSDIRAWCAACGAEDQAADLVAANRQADRMYTEWKQLHRDGMKRVQEEVIALFEQTRQFRVYCSNVMPGMVQQRGYARDLMTAITEFQGTPDDVSDAVKSRLARGRYLHEGNRTFALVLEETVLRYPFGDRDEMRDQLGYLMDVMALPRVSLGVIPFGTKRAMWPLEAFYMFDDRLVEAELLSAAIAISTPGEIATYAKAFGILAGMAVYGRAARALIREAVDALG
ncbi:helix-turn-helix domain-containing protein [Kitasatospora sp. NPDC056446]|uniref:helix-turn-helix domain-containing protein n=1 Tax=Kitasatospora sp. NPDC056446 TaxID=3345819 RepID=UPI00367CA852